MNLHIIINNDIVPPIIAASNNTTIIKSINCKPVKTTFDQSEKI